MSDLATALAETQTAEPVRVEVVETAAPTRREALSQAYDAAQAPAPVADRARDEKGKFAPQVSAPAPTADAAAPTPEPAWKKPPQSWKKDLHDVWGTADPRFQEYAYQREEEMKAGIEPLKSKAQFADEMQAVIAPYEQTIRGLGVKPAQAVQALMEADRILRTAPMDQRRAYLGQLAGQYGISLDGIQQQPGTVADPMVSSLQNELISIKGQFQTFQQSQEEARNQQYREEIDNFRKSAEFFDEASPVMTQLLQSGVAGNLQDAYDKAIRLDPALFEKAQAGQQAKAEAARKAEAAAAVNRARAAAVSPRSSTPGAPTQTKAQDRRSMLSEQLDGLSERL